MRALPRQRLSSTRSRHSSRYAGASGSRMKSNVQRCPNCQQPIDVDRAAGMSGWSRVAPVAFGIRCPKCKKILAASQRSDWFRWVVLFLGFGFVSVGRIGGHLSEPVALLLVAVLGLLVLRWRHPAIRLSQPPAGVALREVTPSEREYAYLEGRDDRASEFRPAIPTAETDSADCTCINCRQPNPASFEACWKCNHPKRTHGG